MHLMMLLHQVYNMLGSAVEKMALLFEEVV